MSIDYQRKDYQRAILDWEMVSDVCAGERTVKDRDRFAVTPTTSVVTAANKRYLPMPNSSDTSPENLLRYQQYLTRAVFYNATGRTLAGLVGTAFRRAPEVELAQIDYLLSDADGQGVGLMQQLQSTLSAVLKKGRHALWVDYPTVSGGASKAQMASGSVRANVLSVSAEQVINWRTTKVGAEQKLGLVVIHEFIEVVGEDGYTVEDVDQYRVLRLGEYVYVDGEAVPQAGLRYNVEVYRATKKGMELAEAYTPTDGAGGSWEAIPFTFIGAVDNNATIDPSPLYDMASINLAHYRNSADYEDSCFFVGQAQPWMSGLDSTWRDWMVEQKMYIGSRTPILLPELGKFGIEQAQPNTLVKEALDQKEAQMIALGARLVTRGETIKTATEAQADNEAEHSVLSLVVENVSEAYTAALGWVARFMKASGDPFIDINRDFNANSMDAQKLTATVAAWQAGAIPLSDMLSSFKRAGLIDSERSDDDIMGELETQTAGLGLEDGGE